MPAFLTLLLTSAHSAPLLFCLQVLFGEDEISAGVVKVKDMDAKTEESVGLDTLVEVLRGKIAEWRARQ